MANRCASIMRGMRIPRVVEATSRMAEGAATAPVVLIAVPCAKDTVESKAAGMSDHSSREAICFMLQSDR